MLNKKADRFAPENRVTRAASVLFIMSLIKELIMVNRYTKENITEDRLKYLLTYNPKDGSWVWNVNRRCNKCKGEIAGSVDNNGYRMIQIDGTLYKSSRLSFLYMTGDFPIHEADHKDRNRANDEWSNLRDITRSNNMKNTKLPKNNKSSVKGVVWEKSKGMWRSQIGNSNTNIFIGRFCDFGEAVLHRLAAEQCFDWYKYDTLSTAYEYAIENGLIVN